MTRYKFKCTNFANLAGIWILLTYCGGLKFSWFSWRVQFTKYSTNEKAITVWIMKENAMATNFEPHECVILAQFTKIGSHSNKAKHYKKLAAFKKCMCRLTNILCYYQKRVTSGQTDRRRTKWSLCAATLCRQHNKYTCSIHCHNFNTLWLTCRYYGSWWWHLQWNEPVASIHHTRVAADGLFLDVPHQ